MAFWDKASKAISTTTAKAAQKTRDLGNTAKLSSQISSEKKTIDRLYQEIGRKYCALYANSLHSEMVSLVSQVQNAQQRIADCERQLRDLKGIMLCPQCGAEVETSVSFCPQCGARM